MKKVYRVCSCCKRRFDTEKDFLSGTVLVGIFATHHYMKEDLELRNCVNCYSTLARKIPKEHEETLARAV